MAATVVPRQATVHTKTQAPEQVRQLPALTGLRFVAAILVVLNHNGIYDRYSMKRSPLDAILGGGSSGVNFFFVLSGFILAYSYLDAGAHLRVTCRTFWIARIARILPVYLLVWFIAIGPYLSTHPTPARTLVTAVSTFTLVQSWLPMSWITVWNAPSWSLSVEAFFYLMFPVLARIAACLTTRRHIYIALLVCWIGCIAFPLLCYPEAIHMLGPLPDSTGAQLAWRDPIVRLPELLLGVVLARLFVTRSQRQHRISPACLSVVAFTLLIVALSRSGTMPDLILHEGIIDPLCGLLIYSIAFGRGPLATAFALPSMLLLGEASYALYILHEPLWAWMTYGRPGLPARADLQTLVFVTIYLGVVVALSLFSLRFVERPMRRFIRAHVR